MSLPVEATMAREALPSNRVIALVRDAATGTAVKEDLAAAGLADATLVTDPGVGEKLEAQPPVLMRTLQRFGDDFDERRYLERYEEAVRHGQAVVAVRARGHTQIRRARDVLRRHGASDIRYFGRLAISTLSSDEGMLEPEQWQRRAQYS